MGAIARAALALATIPSAMIISACSDSTNASSAPETSSTSTADDTDGVHVRGVENAVNESVVKALTDIVEFWEKDQSFSPAFVKPAMFVAVESPDQGARGCPDKVGVINFCGDGIVWNVNGMSDVKQKVGDLGVAFVTASAVGMYIQHQQGMKTSYETSADCLAGIYAANITKGDSRAYGDVTPKDVAHGIGGGLVIATTPAATYADTDADIRPADTTDAIIKARMDSVVKGLHATAKQCLDNHS